MFRFFTSMYGAGPPEKASSHETEIVLVMFGKIPAGGRVPFWM